MQLQWRSANKRSPATTPITISGCHTIRNPSFQVALVLAVIRILTTTVADPNKRARSRASSTPPAVSDDDERLKTGEAKAFF